MLLRSTWRQRDTQWLDYETGVRAAQEFVDLVGKLPFDATPAQAALAWVVQQEGVTTIIPRVAVHMEWPEMVVRNVVAVTRRSPSPTSVDHD
jgi:aryl-alcohol dehydrogenase-like predicted oxidoreductase